MRYTRWTPWLVLVGMVACDGGGTRSTADLPGGTEEPGDARDDGGAVSGDSYDQEEGATVDGGPDPSGDADRPPVPCGDGEACNEPLDAEGRCPGRCVSIRSVLRCDGVVHLGVCLRHVTLEEWPTEVGETVHLRVVEAPPRVTVGDDFTVRIEVRNASDRAVEVPVGWKHPSAVEAIEDPLAEERIWHLNPGQAREIRFALRALDANVFRPESQEYLTLQAGEDVLRVPGAIVFGEEADRACGDWRFPSRWSACRDCSTYDRYETAACCEGVFFPGAQCCGDQDCRGARCVDGRCVPWAPWSGLANTLPLGPQRVIVVVADDVESLPPTGPCGAPWEEGEERIGAQVVEDWFNDRAQARTGLRPLRLAWWFAAVPDSTVFAPEPLDTIWSRWIDLLDRWRLDQGCPPLSDYDKVVVFSPRLDLQGFGGQAGDRGRVGVAFLGSPYLLAHEIAHTFGASDLYLDLAGDTWLRGSLMSNGWGFADPPEDLVTWGEMGLSDLDWDGVVDLAAHLAVPEELELVLLKAVTTPKGSLEVTLAIDGRRGDRWGRVLVPRVRMELPEFHVSREVWDLRREKVAAFDDGEVDLPAVRARGRVTVRIQAEIPVTTEEFRREVLAIDRTRVVRVR